MAAKGPVFVVGAGTAGLAAAFRLKQAGFTPTVLEANDYVGGRIRTVRRDGFQMETGASVVSEAYTSVLSLARDAGLGGELLPAGSIVGIAREGEIHEVDVSRLLIDAVRSRVLSFRSKLAMAKVGPDNFRIRKLLDFEDLSKAADFDTESAADYCDRKLNREIHDYVVDMAVAGLLGTRATEVSKVEFFFCVNKFLGTKLFVFRDGLSSYAQRLASGLDVRLGARVQSVDDMHNEVRVAWEDAAGQHVDTAEACVIAVPGARVPALMPRMPAECAQFLGALDYTHIMSLNVALAKPPPGVGAFSLTIPRTVHDGLIAVQLEHNSAPGRVPAGKGLLTLFTDARWSKVLAEESDDDVVAGKVVDAAELVMPGLGGDVEFVRVNRWFPYVVRTYPGYYKALRRFRQAWPSQGRVHLAGDWFASSNLGSATASGERAARDVISAVG